MAGTGQPNNIAGAKEFNDFNDVQQQVLYYIHKAGPVFVTKLAKRLDSDVDTVRNAVGALREAGFLERVTGSNIEYRLDKRSKVSKHRNHAYFALTRKGRHLFRRNDVQLDVNLRPPYKQA